MHFIDRVNTSDPDQSLLLLKAPIRLSVQIYSIICSLYSVVILDGDDKNIWCDLRATMFDKCKTM